MTTVSELIEMLRKADPTMRVCIDGYEGGYEDIDENHIHSVPIKLNAYGDWSFMGPHGYVTDDENEDEIALVIGR